MFFCVCVCFFLSSSSWRIHMMYTLYLNLNTTREHHHHSGYVSRTRSIRRPVCTNVNHNWETVIDIQPDKRRDLALFYCFIQFWMVVCAWVYACYNVWVNTSTRRRLKCPHGLLDVLCVYLSIVSFLTYAMHSHAGYQIHAHTHRAIQANDRTSLTDHSQIQNTFIQKREPIHCMISCKSTYYIELVLHVCCFSPGANIHARRTHTFSYIIEFTTYDHSYIHVVLM